MQITKIPRLLFAHLPTPVEPMKNLSAYLDGPELWVKRDDQTGLAFGGNKTRKLEYLLAEAVANGAKTLVTGGAMQSNHCRQTAAAASKFGLDCVLVLTKSSSMPPLQTLSGNLLLDQILGAEVVWTRRELRDQALQETFDTLWSQGRRPYLIPYGGSNKIGAIGYANALYELQLQTNDNPEIPFPDTIVVASSSGGTQAGLVAAKNILNLSVNILGISIDEEEPVLKRNVLSLAGEVCEIINPEVKIDPESVQINADYLGKGYGIMGEAEKATIHIFARKEGLLLDPVYTGRAAAGLIDLISKNYFAESEKVLFWHTGGGPALFADQYRELSQ